MLRKIWIFVGAVGLATTVYIATFAVEEVRKPAISNDTTDGGALVSGTTYPPVAPRDSAAKTNLSGVSSENPAWYRFSGIGSGHIGSWRFNSAEFTIVMFSDTSRIVECGGSSLVSIDGSSTIDIEGIPTADFLIGTRVFSNQPYAAVGLSRAGCRGEDLLVMRDPSFVGYMLDTPFGPFLEDEPYAIEQFSRVATNLGSLSFRSIDFVIFQGVIGIAVGIDIKPDGSPNSINPYARGVIPVAILGGNAFDVAEVDLATLRLGPSEAAPMHLPPEHWQDVNLDGYMDLVTHYRTRDTGIACGDESTKLTGETIDGQPFEGVDSIQTVGCRVTRRPAIWMKDQATLDLDRRNGPVKIERK